MNEIHYNFFSFILFGGLNVSQRQIPFVLLKSCYEIYVHSLYFNSAKSSFAPKGFGGNGWIRTSDQGRLLAYPFNARKLYTTELHSHFYFMPFLLP